MQLKTKLTVKLAEDSNYLRKVFDIEDLEEEMATTFITAGDGRGALPIAAAGVLTVDLSQLPANLKFLVVFVTGDVTVKPNGDAGGLRVTSVGTDLTVATFRFGKLIFVSDNAHISALTLTNNDAANAASVMLGYGA